MMLFYYLYFILLKTRNIRSGCYNKSHDHRQTQTERVNS